MNYYKDSREMVITHPSLFQSPRGLDQKVAQSIVAALMASDQKAACAENPRVLAPEAEGGAGPVPLVEYCHHFDLVCC